MYGHSPYLRSHSQIRCAFFRSASSKAYSFLDVRAFALFTLTLANTLRFLSQCIFESLRLSRCTGIRPISRQKYAILCASTVSRISVGCTAHCLRSLYHVMGEQKIPKMSDSDTIFCCRFCRNHPFNTLYIPGGFCLQSVL